MVTREKRPKGQATPTLQQEKKRAWPTAGKAPDAQGPLDDSQKGQQNGRHLRQYRAYEVLVLWETVRKNGITISCEPTVPTANTNVALLLRTYTYLLAKGPKCVCV